MTTLQLKKQTLSNQPNDLTCFAVNFHQSNNLQTMRDCLSFTSFDFELLEESFQKSHTACIALLVDCRDILKSAMCTIAKEFIASSINYKHARDTFLMAVLAAQTTIDFCLEKLSPKDEPIKQELNDLYLSLALSTKSLVH